MESTKNLHIALLPPPVFLGHLIPFIELAKSLVSHHNFTVTLIITDDGKSQRSLLQGIPAEITPVFLPQPPADDDLLEGMSPEVSIPIRVRRSLPAIRSALLSAPPAAALVMDLFSPDAIAVARELRIPAYIFYVIAANELSLAVNLPELDESCPTEEFGDIVLPGGVVLKKEDLPDSMIDKNSDIYKSMFDLGEKCLTADGIFVNSFHELETEALKRLALHQAPPVYPVGPLIRNPEDGESECAKWLDTQPPESVLFVSFGSGGTLSAEQIAELALGLEMSKKRFLWVVRSPRGDTATGYLKAGDGQDPLGFLPEGFVERTKGRGLVVASWAPQIRVLSHASTGGFLTHCGWNSILEGAVHGVPMMAWPLCFEHKMNAVFLTDGLKGALRVKMGEKGIVEREEISGLVKQLMEGEQGKTIRDKMKHLKIAARNILSGDGSSTMPLALVLSKTRSWESKQK